VRAGRREWLGLAVLALPTLLVSFDVFVLLLALPRVSADLGASSTEQLWIMDIYGFMIAGFMVTLGTLGDRIGRRRLLLFGAAGFGIASVLSAYSTSPVMLIIARALLGIAGATLAPSTLALIATMFADAKQRSVAFGIWGGTFTVGAIIGPVIGGAMLEHFWWGSVFLLGVPAMLLLLIAGPLLLPEFRNPAAGRLDPASVALSLGSILPIIFGLKQLARDGLQWYPLAALLIGLALGALFLRRQRRLAEPILNLALFSNRVVLSVLLGMLSYTIVGGTIMLMMSQHFQSVDGMSSLKAAFGLLPGMAAATASFLITPHAAARIRPGYLIGAGLAGTAAVMAAFTQLGDHAGPATLIIGFAVFSFCGAPVVALGTGLVMGAAPPDQAGAAASMAQISNEFGSALGIATLGTLAVAIYRTKIADHLPPGLTPTAAHTAHDSILGAATTATTLPPPQAHALMHPAQTAFTTGLHAATALAALLLLSTATLIATQLKHIPPIGQPTTTPQPEQAQPEEALLD
jgi:MFS transporter, DHA2 family, multidrug resistance protein